MRGRLILSGLLAVASIGCIFYTPNGLPALNEIRVEEMQAQNRYDTARRNIEVAEGALVQTVAEFNEARDFDVYYGDVDRLVEIFEGLPGIEVSSITVVDPTDNYYELYTYQSGSTHSAIRIDLQVTDSAVALSILEAMQLPIVDLSITHYGEITVTFLTGGTV